MKRGISFFPEMSFYMDISCQWDYLWQWWSGLGSNGGGTGTLKSPAVIQYGALGSQSKSLSHMLVTQTTLTGGLFFFLLRITDLERSVHL